MNKRIGIMLARPFEQKLLDKMPEKVIVQAKIDGDRIRAVPTKEGYVLYTSQGNVVKFLQHINKELDEAFSDICFRDMPTLDGEAYLHGWSHQDIRSVVSRKVNEHSQSWAMEYHVFDIIDDTSLQMERIFRLMYLMERVFDGKYKSLRVVSSPLIPKGSIINMLEKYMSEGYEGIIIRDPRAFYKIGRSSQILKLKPKVTHEFDITGSYEAIDKYGAPKDTLGGLTLKDSEGRSFNCGGGTLTHAQRKDYWNYRHKLKGRVAVVKYLTLTDSGIPREPILMEIKDNEG